MYAEVVLALQELGAEYGFARVHMLVFHKVARGVGADG